MSNQAKIKSYSVNNIDVKVFPNDFILNILGKLNYKQNRKGIAKLINLLDYINNKYCKNKKQKPIVKITFRKKKKIHLKELVKELNWKVKYKRIQKRINWLFNHLTFETMIIATKDSPITYDKNSHGEWDIRIERNNRWED